MTLCKVIHYPGFSKSFTSGSLVRSFSTVMDLAPTFLEMAGIEHPAASAKDGLFRGRQVAPMRGKSWLKFLTSDSSSPSDCDGIHDEADTYMGWELFGRGAVRQGKWKMVHIESSMGGGKWQLYDLHADPGETDDLAASEPAKRDELIQLWQDYVEMTGVIWTPHEEIERDGVEWGENREDLIGGNHVGQMRAWIQCKAGEETARGQVVTGG